MQVFIQLGHVMMGLHLSLHISVIKMKPVQIDIDLVQRGLVLHKIGPIPSTFDLVVFSSPGASTLDWVFSPPQPPAKTIIVNRDKIKTFFITLPFTP